MKKTSGLIVGALLVVAGVNAHAVDLRVSGTIIPTSCSLKLTNSVLNLGKISVGDLSAVQYTKLNALSTPFTLSCDGNTRVGIKSVDNRASSKVPGIIATHFGGSYHDNYNYGLGTNSKGQKVGGYVMHMRNSNADGQSVRVLTSTNNGSSWIRGGEALGQGSNIGTWSTTAGSTPIALKTLSGSLEIVAVINRTSALEVTSDVAIDGLATLELRYL